MNLVTKPTHTRRITHLPKGMQSSSKKNTSKRLQAQWEICLDERRRKYKQYIVSKSLGSKQNATCNYDVREKDNERSSGTSLANRREEIQAYRGKVTKRHKEPVESKLDVKLGDNKTSYEPRIDASENSNEDNLQQHEHTWKRGTVLIMGDSMLYGVGEKKLSKNEAGKVRCFSGSKIKDLHHFHMKPLLTKKPSKVILHDGTNDAVNKEATTDQILDALLDLKKEIETTLPDCTIVLSMPMRRLDNRAAGKIMEMLNKKILSLRLSVVNNQNISEKGVGRRRLHLNNK